jgi:hypothetical protein
MRSPKWKNKQNNVQTRKKKNQTNKKQKTNKKTLDKTHVIRQSPRKDVWYVYHILLLKIAFPLNWYAPYTPGIIML